MDNKDSEKTKEELMKLARIDQEHVREQYDKIANEYEHLIVDLAGYPDPIKISEALEKLGVRKDVPILDFGCGTGLVGKFCIEKGYTNISGVDASPEMLKIAKERGYKELTEAFLGANKFPSELEGKFEVAASAGAICAGHVSPDIFEDKLKCLKKIENEDDKRYMMFVVLESYINSSGHWDKIKELENQGKIEHLETLKFTKYENSESYSVDRFAPSIGCCYIYEVKKL